MEKNRKGLAEWALERAEEYLQSAKSNFAEGRLYVAAEEAFRAMENSLEALLYARGIETIRYPGKTSDYKGRLALQFLARDNLVGKTITKQEFGAYLDFVDELHRAGYEYGVFDKETVKKALGFVEKMFFKARARS